MKYATRLFFDPSATREDEDPFQIELLSILSEDQKKGAEEDEEYEIKPLKKVPTFELLQIHAFREYLKFQFQQIPRTFEVTI